MNRGRWTVGLLRFRDHPVRSVERDSPRSRVSPQPPGVAQASVPARSVFAGTEAGATTCRLLLFYSIPAIRSSLLWLRRSRVRMCPGSWGSHGKLVAIDAYYWLGYA